MYSNVNTRILVRCPKGHQRRPAPKKVLAGGGICATCVGRDTAATEARFRQLVADRGGTVLGAYSDTQVPVLICCSKGHENRVRPNSVLRGVGFCRTCAGVAKGISEPRFREAVAAQGGQVVGAFTNMNTPVLVRCAKGHEARPRPTHVLQGIGICRTCAGHAWDAFYVVRDQAAGVVKFGITSGDPRPRLRSHASDGFDEVVRVHRDLPDETARELENNIKAALRDAREAPVRGAEYFSDRALPLVLDLVDNHPVIRQITQVAA
ncbi:hypothetical protein ACR6C2_07570 [Streptomyces sp. INA 01156]